MRLSKGILSLSLLAAIVGATAVASADMQSSADAPLVVPLHAQNGSNEDGTATFIPQGDKTMVIVSLTGTPDGVAQPAHIHMGSCEKLNPAPKYPLTLVKSGVSESTVPVPLSTLLASPFAVNVHESANDLAHYVACGNITKG